jgi:hypothetical protein
MDNHELNVKVGDRVAISRPGLGGRFAARVERLSTVTAVRPRSFDAGGLCFRYDGREWSGHNRIRLIPREEDEIELRTQATVHEADLVERAVRAREDVILAFVLSCRHQDEWLKLGLSELSRIAALHGITSARAEAITASQRQLSTLPPLNPWQNSKASSR